MSNIPIEVQEPFDQLRTEIAWLHGRWIVYQQLFGESQLRIDLLNESASAYFWIIQDVLMGNVQISLSKLTDPAKTSGQANLSLEHLQEKIELHGDPTFSQALRQRLNAIHLSCQPFRQWRNKQLAHLDLNTVKHATMNPLPGISQQMIEDALLEIREYMNSVERLYDNSEYGYEHFILDGDGSSLVQMLKYGMQYKELFANERVQFEEFTASKWFKA